MIIIEDVNLLRKEDLKFCLIYVLEKKPGLPPLGAGHIAAALKKANLIYHFYTVIIDDGCAIDEWLECLDFDVYLFSIYDWNVFKTKELIEKIKEHQPESKIIVGGHCCYDYKSTFEELNPDFAVIGDGEETITELIDCIKHEKDPKDIKGIAYKKQDKLIVTAVRQASDLNNVPSPYLNSVFNQVFYKDKTGFMFCRGCLFNCTYCYWGSPKESGKFRKKDVSLVVKELKKLWKAGVRRIQSQDSMFNFSTEYLKEINNELKKDNICFEWTDADCRADFMDEKQVKLMKEMGVVEIGLGIETVNPATQKIIKNILT